MILDTNDITFRKLQEEDLQLMFKWLNTDFVIEWFGKKNHSYDEIIKKYMPYIREEIPTYSFIIVYKCKDIGYIQTYLIEDYPEYSQYVQEFEKAAGLDLFIGEKECIHIGLGKHIISKFLKEYVFPVNNAISCIIGPEPKNKAAITAYEKVGFKYLKTIQIPDENEPEYLMRLVFKDIV